MRTSAFSISGLVIVGPQLSRALGRDDRRLDVAQLVRSSSAAWR